MTPIPAPATLECVANLSEGQDHARIERLAAATGATLLDVHIDPDHHRSVITIGGVPEAVEAAARALATVAVSTLDLRAHEGAHPRIGVLDVVPFVSLTTLPSRPGAGAAGRDGVGTARPLGDGDRTVAIGARDRFVAWAGDALELPCFAYGSERSLPDVRRQAWAGLVPTSGPPVPHPTAGAAAVGARPILVAYNLWLARPDIEEARRLARQLRGPDVRALGLAVGAEVQVSCNLIRPVSVGPEAVFDIVAAQTGVARTELVGLVPAAVVAATAPHRWSELDLDPSKTIEARLEQAGLDGGSGLRWP